MVTIGNMQQNYVPKEVKLTTDELRWVLMTVSTNAYEVCEVATIEIWK